MHFFAVPRSFLIPPKSFDIVKTILDSGVYKAQPYIYIWQLTFIKILVLIVACKLYMFCKKDHMVSGPKFPHQYNTEQAIFRPDNAIY